MMTRMTRSKRNAAMGGLIRAVAALLAAVAGGCHGATNVEGEAAEPEPIPILWETQGSISHIARPLRVVARDAATLAQVPVVEVPVDFETQMVLIAALGPSASDQVGVRIDRVYRLGRAIHVQVRMLHPGEAKHGGLRRTSPYHVVVIPRSDLNVVGFSPVVPPGAIDLPGVPGTPAGGRDLRGS
jgi:hypothetical protein